MGRVSFRERGCYTEKISVYKTRSLQDALPI